MYKITFAILKTREQAYTFVKGWGGGGGRERENAEMKIQMPKFISTYKLVNEISTKSDLLQQMSPARMQPQFFFFK